MGNNDFFMPFRNTLAYDTPAEFLQKLQQALDSQPMPLSAAERRELSWDGATARFLQAIRNATELEVLPSFADRTTQWVHQGIQKGGYIGDVLRSVSGAGPIARQSWLQEQRYRDAAVTEIVDQSVALSPPLSSREDDQS
ncbi:MAG: hypothetical protein SGPRY_003344 [Prymnesium sp.]